MAAKSITPKKVAKKEYTYARGRRRTAAARARLYKGDKESTVNGVVIGQYFPGAASTKIWQKPFELTDNLGKYYVTTKVAGGGKVGQLQAVVHAISRSFVALDTEKYRAVLKSDGLLARDGRIRERRMVGTGGKSRRKKSSPKR